MYDLLRESFKEQHKELVKIILEAVAAEKIYLLGSTVMNSRTETIFIADSPSCRYVSHYYVLVLVNSERDFNAIQDKIENTCRHFIPVTAIILPAQKFTDWLGQSHQFTGRVHKIAILLHGEDERKNLTPEISDAELLAKNKSIYSIGLNKVKEFIAGADLYIIREQNKMAAFMLHQAAEHTLHTILKIMTGLYINTHNIDKLIRYCTMTSYLIPGIFPKNNQKNERLLQLLNKAYVETRYTDDYSISTTDVMTISERVLKLQNVMTDLWEAELNKPKYQPKNNC